MRVWLVFKDYALFAGSRLTMIVVACMKIPDALCAKLVKDFCENTSCRLLSLRRAMSEDRTSLIDFVEWFDAIILRW